MADRIADRVKCPYYRENNHAYMLKRPAIRCEGPVEGSVNVLVFDTKAAEGNWRGRYCNGIDRCRKCPIHIMLDHQWEMRENQ